LKSDKASEGGEHKEDADGGGAAGSSGASCEGGGSGGGDACTEGKEGKEGTEGTAGGRRAPLALQLPEGYAVERGKFLPIGSLTSYPSAVHPVFAGDGIPHLILELLLPATLGSLPQSTGIENVRGACRGGWMFIECNVKATFIDAMCSSAASIDAAAVAAAAAAAAEAEWECDECRETNMPEDEECTECGDGEKPPAFVPNKLCDLYEKWLKSSPTGAPATGADKMALCRGLQQKAVMINLVNELQVEDVNVDAPLKEWEGVTVGADGQVVEIDFSYRCKGGDLAQLQLPVGVKDVHLAGTGVTGKTTSE
jgi:hypothetical protein